MSPQKKLDKRLYAAKIIGIILFIMSIIFFCANIMAGLMSIFMFPKINHVSENSSLFFAPFQWLFSNYTVLTFSLSVVWIPLFFASRALYKFKEWGRVVSVFMLFFLMLMLVFMTVFISTVNEVPLIFRLWMIIVYSIYIAHPAVGAYFLMRRSTREGIRDYNLARKTIPIEPAPVIPSPLIKDPRYDLAKELVAEVKEKPYPIKRKGAALIVAGIMMIVFPAIWVFFSFIYMVNSYGISILYAFLSIAVSVFTVLMGITVIWHRKKYRLWAILSCAGSLIMLVILLYPIPIVGILIFCSYYIAILTLLLINYNKFYEEEGDDEASSTEKTLSPLELEIQALQELTEAKDKGEINQSEFGQRTIEIKVKYRILDMAESLLKRRNNGMLTEEEYQRRLENLRLEKQAEVEIEMRQEKEKQELHALRLSHIASERVEKLSIPNQSRLNKYIDLMEPSDIIVFHDQQIKLIHAERWTAINEANTQDQFEIIFRL